MPRKQRDKLKFPRLTREQQVAAADFIQNGLAVYLHKIDLHCSLPVELQLENHVPFRHAEGAVEACKWLIAILDQQTPLEDWQKKPKRTPRKPK